MEWVLAWVVVVQYDLYHIVLVEYVRVRVPPVYCGVVCKFTSSQGRVESWNLWTHVGDAVEEGIVRSIAQVVHRKIEVEGVVDLVQKLHPVVRYQIKIIELSVPAV